MTFIWLHKIEKILEQLEGLPVLSVIRYVDENLVLLNCGDEDLPCHVYKAMQHMVVFSTGVVTHEMPQNGFFGFLDLGLYFST